MYSQNHDEDFKINNFDGPNIPPPGSALELEDNFDTNSLLDDNPSINTSEPVEYHISQHDELKEDQELGDFDDGLSPSLLHTEIAPELYFEATTSSPTPLEPISARPTSLSKLLKYLISGCGIFFCGCCVVCFCCICCFVIFLFVAGGYAAAIYFECVSGNTVMFHTFNITSSTEKLVFTHIGSFSAFTSNDSSSYMIVRATGKKDRLPNFEFVEITKDNITSIVQKHLTDGSIVNDIGFAICEEVDIELFLPANKEIEVELNSKLLGNDLLISGLKNLTSLTLNPTSANNVIIKNSNIHGNVSVDGTSSQFTLFSDVYIKHYLTSSSIHGDTFELNNVDIEKNMILFNEHNNLYLNNVTVTGSSKLTLEYTDLFLEEFETASKLEINTKHGDLKFDDFEIGSIFIENADYGAHEFTNGFVNSDFTVKEMNHGEIYVENLVGEWGVLELSNVNHGEVRYEDLKKMSVKVVGTHTDVEINLDSTYFKESDDDDNDSVRLKLVAEYGGIRIQDPRSFVTLTKEDEYDKEGYINYKKGTSTEYFIEVNSDHGDIELNFE